MKRKILYKSDEVVDGRLIKYRETIRYLAVLTVREGGKEPVSLELELEPPQPFAIELPETRRIRGKSVTQVYARLAKFFRLYHIQFLT